MDNGRIKKLLIVSVLVNVLLLGVILGYGFGELWRDKDRPPRRFPQKIFAALPEAKQKALKKEINHLRKGSRQDFKQLRHTRHQVMEILTAPQFDAAAYEAKMKELHEIQNRLQDQKIKVIKDLAENLNQQERQALAELMQKHHGSKKGHRRPPPPADLDRRGPPPGNGENPPPPP